MSKGVFEILRDLGVPEGSKDVQVGLGEPKGNLAF